MNADRWLVAWALAGTPGAFVVGRLADRTGHRRTYLVGVTWAVVAVTATTLVTRLAPAAIRGEVLGVYAALVALAGAACVLGVRWVGRASAVAADSERADHNA